MNSENTLLLKRGWKGLMRDSRVIFILPQITGHATLCGWRRRCRRSLSMRVEFDRSDY